MPRTPRNPGSGKKPYNGPAQGPGWGGPAGHQKSGLASIATQPEWEKGKAVNPGAVPGPRALHRQQQAEVVLDRLVSVALGEMPQVMPVEVMAQKEFLNRVHGMPTQEQKHTGDMNFTIVTGVPRADD